MGERKDLETIQKATNLDMLVELTDGIIILGGYTYDRMKTALKRAEELGAMNAQGDAAGLDEVAWLVELQQGETSPLWWGRGKYGTGWVYDANDGFRFARKQDAENLIWAFGFKPPVKAVEHMWSAAPQQGAEHKEDAK